jgi:Winged helix-turn helix
MPSPRAVQTWARRPKSAQALAQRSRIVLAAAQGLKNSEIADGLGMTRPMITKWRSRFAEQRLDGLVDEPRPGRPRTVTDEQVEEVITKTLSTSGSRPPPDHRNELPDRLRDDAVGLDRRRRARRGARPGDCRPGPAPAASRRGGADAKLSHDAQPCIHAVQPSPTGPR